MLAVKVLPATLNKIKPNFSGKGTHLLCLTKPQMGPLHCHQLHMSPVKSHADVEIFSTCPLVLVPVSNVSCFKRLNAVEDLCTLDKWEVKEDTTVKLFPKWWKGQEYALPSLPCEWHIKQEKSLHLTLHNSVWQDRHSIALLSAVLSALPLSWWSLYTWHFKSVSLVKERAQSQKETFKFSILKTCVFFHMPNKWT